MEEKVYRQRRNLMITCIGIILFYLGPGDFKEIGLLKNLGLHTLEAWQLKAMILVMYLYYGWRYYQYSSEYPGVINREIEDYLQASTPSKFWVAARTFDDNQHSMTRTDFFNSDPKFYQLTHKLNITGPLSEWRVTLRMDDPPKAQDYPSDNFNPQVIPNSRAVILTVKSWQMFILRLKTLARVCLHKTGFTDWIMPWLFFWGTWALVIWNELIYTA